MKPTRILDRARTPAGEEMTLSERDGTYTVRVRGHILMCSSEHHSEEEMARIACRGWDSRVLVGGLGLGYTLRAALDRLGPRGEVVVAELMPAVAEWNYGPLGSLASYPLRDVRTTLVMEDVIDVLRDEEAGFDGILLDVDNGPEAFTVDTNDELYEQRGLRILWRALRPRGALVVWSAFASQDFERELARAGFDVEAVTTRSRGAKGALHTLFIGRRREDGQKGGGRPRSLNARRGSRPRRRRRRA